MSKKKKILIGLVAILLLGAYVGKSFAFPTRPVHMKIGGEIYVLPKQFTLNMADSRYATLTVALELAPGQSDGASAEGADASSTDGIGTLPEEAVIRDIITNIITDQDSDALITASGRAHLKQQILGAIRSGTDVKVTQIFFTDIAVQ